MDLPGFESPSIVTGDEYRPDLLLLTSANHLYIVELTVGFESNLTKNTKRKHAKYKNLTENLTNYFTTVKLINLSISSLGVFDKECQSFVKMLSDLSLDINSDNIIATGKSYQLPSVQPTTFSVVEIKSGKTRN